MNKKKKASKKMNPIVSIINGLYKVVDKIIVTPISRIVYRTGKVLNKKSGTIDKLLNSPHSLLIISLVIAVFGFLLVDSKAINLVETESEIISGQDVTSVYNEEKYVVEGIPEKVDIILMGRKSDLYLAKQLGEHKVMLDLSDYKTGEYTVKLKYNHAVESVTYKLDPSTITVKISEKVSDVKTLSYDLVNQDKLDSKLNVSKVELKESEVYVKGSSETLKKVATVKTLIDVSTLELTDSGTHDVDSLPLVAYDENGKLVENVEIVPSTASATIKVDSYFVDLPVKAVPMGSLATGYAIISAVPSVSTVRVYGDQEIISKLSSISAEIDVDGLSSDKKFNVTLTKPSGVRHMSENTASVDVKVGEETTLEIPNVSIDAENLGSEYVANATSLEDKTCTVILKGADSVLKAINPKTIQAYVDLSGYGPGTHDVPLQVRGEDPTIKYSAQVKTIQIRISKTN